MRHNPHSTPFLPQGVCRELITITLMVAKFLQLATLSICEDPVHPWSVPGATMRRGYKKAGINGTQNSPNDTKPLTSFLWTTLIVHLVFFFLHRCVLADVYVGEEQMEINLCFSSLQNLISVSISRQLLSPTRFCTDAIMDLPAGVSVVHADQHRWICCYGYRTKHTQTTHSGV